MREIEERKNALTCITPKKETIKVDLIIFSDSFLLVTVNLTEKKKFKPIEFFKFYSKMTKKMCRIIRTIHKEKNEEKFSILIISARFQSLKYDLIFDDEKQRDEIFQILMKFKSKFSSTISPTMSENNLFNLKVSQTLTVRIPLLHILKDTNKYVFLLVTISLILFISVKLLINFIFIFYFL